LIFISLAKWKQAPTKEMRASIDQIAHFLCVRIKSKKAKGLLIP